MVCRGSRGSGRGTMPTRNFQWIRRTTPAVRAAWILLILALFSIGFLKSRVQASETGQSSGSAIAGVDSDPSLWSISIDYPEDGSIFPPGITPPTFLWRDAAGTSWNIDVLFARNTPPIHVHSKGERLRIGTIDPDCVGNTDDQPKLTPRQAATRTWTPDAATWAAIQKHSSGRPASVRITGYRDGQKPISRSSIFLSTSTDPVGAPIFYRDVPLMPTMGVSGVVQPLAPSPIHLIHWRLRDIRKPESRTVLQNMPTCANCHSFSADGKTIGMDVDGPGNDKGLYAVVPVQRHISILEIKICCSGTSMAGSGRSGSDSCRRSRPTADTS